MYTMKTYLVIFTLSSYIVSFCIVWKHIKMYHLSRLSVQRTHNRSHAYTDSCTSISHFFVCVPSTSLSSHSPQQTIALYTLSVLTACRHEIKWNCLSMDGSFLSAWCFKLHSSYCWVRVLIVYSNFSFLFIWCWLISLFPPLSYSNATKNLGIQCLISVLI